MQGQSFKADVRLLPLIEYDLILGIHWLQSLGQILCDSQGRSATFKIEGKLFHLNLAPNPVMKWATDNKGATSIELTCIAERLKGKESMFPDSGFEAMKKVGTIPTTTTLPIVWSQLIPKYEPKLMLDNEMRERVFEAMVMWLVGWCNHLDSEVFWKIVMKKIQLSLYP